jgi:hypothetical protein
LKLNGPTQTGAVANLSPSAASAFGDMIIPARSASWAVSGEYGVFRWRITVFAPLVATDPIGEISLARVEPFSVRCRSSEVLTAAALNAVPSLNLIPVRSLIV